MNLTIELSDLQFKAIEREAHRANTIPNELIGWALIRLCWQIHEREALARGDEPDAGTP
jgi:hypothetical protein